MNDTTRQMVAYGGHDGRSPITVRIICPANDPFAIVLSFHGTNGWKDWVVARDLLSAGLIMPAGEGDVRITPPDQARPMQIHLLGRNGDNATFEIPDSRCVADLLNCTARAAHDALLAARSGIDDELAALLNA